MTMDRYVLTHSLHEAVRWFVKLEDKPVDDLLTTLRLEKTEPTEKMQRGIAFE